MSRPTLGSTAQQSSLAQFRKRALIGAMTQILRGSPLEKFLDSLIEPLLWNEVEHLFQARGVSAIVTHIAFPKSAGDRYPRLTTEVTHDLFYNMGDGGWVV